MEDVKEVIAGEMPSETRDEMLARHRSEIKNLQNKEIEMKKGAAKGSKAEQKVKKKQVEEEILKQSAKLKEKQAEELAKLGYCGGGGTNDQNKDNLEILVKAIAGVSVSNSSQAGAKPSKSVKRREKRAQEEAAREQRIKDEQSNTVSDRAVEDEKLEEKLNPLGLTINQVKPDGHCLYRAVEDQLSRLSVGGSSPHTFQELREMVASYMREHPSDFLPFFLSSEGGENESESSNVDKFESYCKEVESSAAWGGQLEIGAMTHSLRKHVLIYSGSFPDVEMGKEYKSTDQGSIMLSYHRHAFGLGEHYNSVVPLSRQ